MDAVILYVDGSDPLWQRDYKRANRVPVETARFRDWGTLPFLFRGIDKYMPFIEKVHLVVARESQVPCWIDREKVNVVLHEDIIPQDYLPTFNSTVIETHIPYIKDLSEEFIYFNDDMFPINPCEPELFFRDGRPQEAFSDKNIMYDMNNIYLRQCWNAMCWARDAFGMEQGMSYVCPKHGPHAMLKSYCLEILDICKDKYRKQVSKLRTRENVNQYLFVDYIYLGGLSDRVEQPWAFIHTGKMTEDILRDKMFHSQDKVLGINDNGCGDEGYPKRREMLFNLFMEKFPEMSKYERERENKGDLIVAMTTYPARANDAAKAWHSVLRQEADTPFRCVMPLYEGDFPGRKLPACLAELTITGQVEVLWYPKNIRSHLKLLPVMKAFPEAAVITIDDDMTKPQGWLQNMIDDHRKWPEDIISCSYTFHYDSNFQWHRMKDLPQEHAQGKNDIPSIVFQFTRICSGHGTLFPAHTYDNTGFFDEDTAMRLVPTCDETWMWMWAMLAGKNFRQSSWVFDESKYTLPGTQQLPTTLWRTNKKIYDQMYAGLFEAYPQFREEIRRRQRLYALATEKTLEKVKKKNPYVPVMVGEFSEEILKAYQDRPNRIIRTDKATLYPPGTPSSIKE